MTTPYPKILEYLFGLQWHGIKLGLENIHRLMGILGNPHKRFRSIHIGGTNGKGSTAAMIASVLEAAGYRTGLYTSPHLVDFTERIRVNGEPISAEQVTRLTEKIRKRAEDLPLTFFEFTTAIAFQHFSDSAVDFGVVEVGMGGRFDATNVLTPLVTVITNVDFDHQAYLGNTLDRISSEKAGIIKPSVPVVTGASHAEAIEVIRETCLGHNAPLYQVGKEIRIEAASPHQFHYYGTKWSLPDLNCGLEGRHQQTNAACALAALELMEHPDGKGGVPIGKASVRKGLKSVRWEGRLERMTAGPSGATILLDGAHNPAGARALRAYLEEARPVRSGRLILVLGMLRDKDIDGVLSEIVPMASEVVITRPDYERAASVQDLRQSLIRYRVPVAIHESVPEAVRYALSVAAAADWICVTGSLFTVGDARSHLAGLAKPSPIRG